jgi:hypothetical protein
MGWQTIPRFSSSDQYYAVAATPGFWCFSVLIEIMLICSFFCFGDRDDDRDKWTRRLKSTYQIALCCGAIHVFAASLALSTYSIETLLGNNYFYDSSTYYHGPAPIVGYQHGILSSNNSDRIGNATITVAFGGNWACPQSQSDGSWCEARAHLSGCDYYDVAAFWVLADTE